MILKNSDIINYINALPALANASLPVSITYAIKKNGRKLVSEYKDYEEELNRLREKYPDLDNNNPELQELLAIEVPIDLHMIPESAFETGTFTLSPAQLEILDFMIESE